ncbi:MAG: S-layer homology domain-containing protein, partial [Oscillospiraceae bacterium]|nr:S-layer homology domain-containing protein [Oscillospiraceae bacterium]
MKRFLSLILAMVMLISLIPAYAAPAEGGSGITVKYDFTNFDGVAVDVNTKTVTDYNTSYGFWKFRAAGHGRTAAIQSVADYTTKQSTSYVHYSTNTTLVNAENLTGNNAKDSYIAYEIYVPEAGNYDITLEYMQCGSYGAVAQMFIFPATTSDSSLLSMMQSEWNEKDKVYRQGDVFRFCNKDIPVKNYGSAYVALGEKYFDKGNYIIAIAATDKEQGNGTYANRYMGFRSITLDGGKGSVPMALVSEAEKNAVAPNGGTAKMTVKAVMSDSSLADYSDKVTYTVIGNATVTQDGTITGGDEGDATVTATLSLEGGGKLTTSQVFKVANAGVKIKYTPVSDAIANETSGFLSVLDETYTNGFYKFHGLSGKSGTSSTAPGGNLAINSNGLRLHNIAAVGFDVYIPMAGNYTMEMTHALAINGTSAAVWLGKVNEVKFAYKKNTLGKQVGSYLCYPSGADEGKTSKTSYIHGITITEPGWYTLSFTGDTLATVPEGVTWGSYIYVGDFNLTFGTGESVPMKETITVDPSGNASVAILLSDKTYMDMSKATVKWKSSNPSVADIGEDNGLIMDYAGGDTEISAEVYFDGVIYTTVKYAYNVTEVPCAGVTQTYNFLKIQPEWAPYTNKDSENPQTTNPNLAADNDIFDIKYDYTDGNWEWFGVGPQSAVKVAKTAKYYSNYLRLNPGSGRWYALAIRIDEPGKYGVNLEYLARTDSAGDANIYIAKRTATQAEMDPFVNKKTRVGYVNFHTTSKDSIKSEIIGKVDIKEKGDYVIIFEHGTNAGPLSPRALTLDGINNMKFVEFAAERDEVTFGETVATSISAKLLDGAVLSGDDYTVSYESSNPDIASVDENGIITGKGHGEATITATVSTANVKVSKSIIINAIDDTEVLDSVIKIGDSLYVGEKSQISVVLSMKSGNEIALPREDVVFSTNKEDVLTFADAGYVFAAKECGSVKISASATFRGESFSADKEISVILDDGKTEATYYTTEKRENAKVNTATYDWAKSMKKSAEKTAEPYVENLDYFYDLIIAEGLPRSTRTGGPKDPYYNLCRYCNGGMNKKGSLFLVDVVSRPWQTQCPECKRLFPSNDFEGFLKLGLDREGRFDRMRALEAHRAMLLEMNKSLPDMEISDERKVRINNGEFLTAEERAYYGFGVDGGYLVNKLYPELSDPAKIPESLNNQQGLREGEDWKTWGVDDGWGYVPLQPDGVTPYKYSSVAGDSVEYADECHDYVAYINSVMMFNTIPAVLEALRDAYLYTDDIKYGRAGAILLDRMADVYHTYDLFIHNDIDYDHDSKYHPDRLWYNTDGGGLGVGIIAGDINANVTAQTLALCADAFYPALCDTQVIDYLSQKAKRFGYDTLPDDDKYNFHRNYYFNYDKLNSSAVYGDICEGECREYEHEMRRNAKISSHDIWKNWENGIIRKNYWGVQFGRITGNFGQRQATTSLSAIVQDRQPETTEMLDWIYKTATTDTVFRVNGGGVTTQLIDVIDRDGMGDESSMNYNRTQIEGLGKMADFLADYEAGAKYNLYDNPKFREMFIAFTRPVVPEGHPKMADASAALSHGFYGGDFEIWKKGFKELRDTDIADELAQYIWTRNGRTTEGLHYDIFTKNPESFKDEVEALIDENGRLKSELMAGFGFAALQDGGIYNSASASTETNNQRAIWMTAGDTGGHGHPDALAINVDGFGLDLGADLAYPENTGYNPNRIQWSSQTVSHNTVMINKESSNGTELRGFPLHFNDSGMVKLMDMDASHKYADAENYRRSVVMVKINDDTSYGVDFFRVTGGNHHTYIYHSASSKVNEVSGLKMATEPELIQVDKNGTMDWATYAGKDAAYVKNPDGSVRRALPGETVDFETVFPVTYGQDPWTLLSTGSYETMFPRGYTWLRNVRRAADPQSSFTVDFEITDYKKVLSNPKGIHLRMTQVNDFTPTGVAFAGGHVPQRSEASKNIGYKDRFDADRATMLEYVYVEREAPEGQELDSLFTTVYEPYRNTSNIEKIEAVDVSVVSGTEQSGDMARAVKVTHVGGERIDYVVYATNNSVKYNVGGVFDFRGFVGVYSTNSEGAPTYRYVHDGNIIGDEIESKGTLTGKVEGFERNLAFKNYIDISAEVEDASALAGEYIFIANDGADNAVYKIEGASALENHSYGDGKNVIRLDIDRTTLIRGHQDAAEPEKGYIYNIAAGQNFRIPLSYNEDFSPEFEPVSTSLTTSAGSSISIPITAFSPVEEDAPTITYMGTTLPRGASINAETGVFTWKPDSSQIGENHVAITARDADGRESTVHFTVTVYGSTTGGSSSNDSTETPSENTGASGDTSTPAGGGGGGGGGAAPTDKADEETKTDETNDDESLLLEEKVPGEGEADEVEKTQFTDLDSHTWAEDAINTLAADGIIKGTSASTFSPAANITRADFAILLVRAFKLESENTENFADVSASDYFASELAIARNNGIVSGIGDNKFAPRNSITRQDMMVIVYRALSSLPLEGSEAQPNVGAAMNDSPVDYQNRDVTEPQRDGDRRMAVDEVLSQYPD